MAIERLSQASILTLNKYSSMMAGLSNAGDFELINTQVLASAAAQVDFTVTGLGATYKHLQVRIAAIPVADKVIQMRFNNDTATNYSYHGMEGAGTSVGPFNGTTQNYCYIGYTPASSTFPAVAVIDIADAFSANKSRTVKSLFGSVQTGGNRIQLISSGWYSTASLTTVSLLMNASAQFASGSRFSLYGVRG